MKRNAPRVNNPARLARLRDQAIKLRERVKRSKLAFLERNQARFTWWQRAFRVPMVADWAVFANAKSLLAAFMALLGLATGKKSSFVALMVEGSAPQASRLQPRSSDILCSRKPEMRNTSRNRRRLQVEGLEQRQLMATFQLAGLDLHLDLTAASTTLAMTAGANNYTLTLTGGDTWTSSNIAGATGSGSTSLIVTKDAFRTIYVGDSNTGAAVKFNDSGANTYTDELSVVLDAATAGTITFAGTTSMTDSNGLSVYTARNILVNGGATVSTVNGDLTLQANQQATPTAGNFIGVGINGGTVGTTGIGNIVINGKAGTFGNQFSNGVEVAGGGVISSTAAGRIRVSGTGGVGTNNNSGVHVRGANSKITSAVGDIEVTGLGEGGTVVVNTGIRVDSGGVVSSTGSAKITLDGTGAASGSNFNYGFLLGETNSKISSVNGDVRIIGRGALTATGNQNTGINIENFGQIVSTGSAKLTLIGTGGTGGNDNYGVDIRGSSRISSVNGDIAITGTAIDTTGTSQEGVRFDTTTLITTGTAAVTIDGTAANAGSLGINLGVSTSFTLTGASNTLIANSININTASATISAAANTVSLQQKSNGTQINLGAADAAGVLGLTDAELDRITAGTINIGNANSGVITFSADITRPISTNVNLQAGNNNNIAFGTFLLNAGSGGDVSLTTSGTGAVTTGDNTGTDLTADDVTLIAGSNGIGTTTNFLRLAATTVTATTSGNGSINLVEADRVNIGDNDLNAGSGTISLGGGTFLTTATGSILSPATVRSGATVGGTGTTAAVTTQSGGSVAPGNNGPGLLKSGNVTLVSGSTFAVEVGGTTPGNAATNYDQLIVTGTVSLGNATLTMSAINSFVPVNGNSFTIIENDGNDPIAGTFNGLAEGASISNFLGASGVNAVISYVGGSGNDVVLTIVTIDSDFVYHTPLLQMGLNLDVFVLNSTDMDPMKAELVVQEHGTTTVLKKKNISGIGKLVDIKTAGNVYILTGLWTDGDDVSVTASNIEVKGTISTVSKSGGVSPPRAGDLTLIARNKSNDIVSGITGFSPIFAEARIAKITLTDAQLDVGTVEIKAEGQSGARWDDVGGIGAKIADSLLSKLQAIPQIGLSVLLPLSGQAKVHRATANITLDNTSIKSTGNVAIEADAFADASINAISLGGANLNKSPVSISIAFSHSFSEATIDLNGSSKIDAPSGNIKISTNAESKSKVDAKSDANTGIQTGIEAAFNLALAMTEETSTIKVGEKTDISGSGSVDIKSNAKVKNESSASTNLFQDGTGALTVALGFDDANVKTEVYGTVTSRDKSTQNGFAIAAVQVRPDTRRIELKNVPPSQVVHEGDRLRFESDAQAGAYGLVPGESYTVESITNSELFSNGTIDQSFRLRRGEVVSLDARQVSEGSKHSLRKIDLAYFKPSDVSDLSAQVDKSGIVKLTDLPAGVTHVTYRGPKFDESNSSNESDEVLVGIEGLIQDQDYQIVPATGGGYHLRQVTKLKKAIDNKSTTTTVALKDISIFSQLNAVDPTKDSFPFNILIGSEEMRVVSRSGSDMTVVRAVNGTTIADHAVDAFVSTVSNVQFKVPTMQPGTEQPLTDEQKKQIHAFAYTKNIQTFEPSKENVVDPKANTILLADGHGFKTGDFVIYETDDTKKVEKTVHYYDIDGKQQDSLGKVSLPDAPIDGLGDYHGYRVIVDPSNPNLIRLSSLIQMEKLVGSGTPTYQTIADTVVLNSNVIGGNHRLVPIKLVQGINISSSLEAENTSDAGSTMSDEEQPAAELASNALSGRLDSIAMGGMKWIDSLRKGATTNAVTSAADKAKTSSGSGTNFDVAGSFALNLFNHNVTTTIGSKARLVSDSDLTVDGKIEQKTQLKASAEATRNGVGKSDGTVTAATTPPADPPAGEEKGDEIEIAAAVAVGVYSNKLNVTITDGAVVNAADDLQVNAKVEYPMLTDSVLDAINPLKSLKENGLAGFEDILDGSGGIGQMFNVSVSTLAGTETAKLALGGGIAVTYVTNEVTAEIGKDVLINQPETPLNAADPTQSVTVTAELTAKVIEVGQQSSFNLNLDGASSVGEKLFSKEYATALSDLVVPLGVSGKSAIGGVMVLSIVDNAVTAKIHTSAKVAAKDRVSVDAKNAYSNISVVQTGTASTDFGFTAAIAVGVFDLTTIASIDETVTITTGKLAVNAQDESDRIAIVGGFLKGKQVGIGTSVGVNVVDQQVDAFIGTPNPAALVSKTISASEEVNVTATTKGEIFALVMAGALQGSLKPDKPAAKAQSTTSPNAVKPNTTKSNSSILGPVALTIPVAVNIINSDVKAYIDRQNFETQSVTVESLTETSVLQVVIGASFAVQREQVNPPAPAGKLTLGGAGAVALAMITQNSSAFIQNSTITAIGSDSITVKATDKSESDIYAGGIGVAGSFATGGKAAISFGASVAINYIDGATKAFISGSQITASGAVNVNAIGDSTIFTLSIAGGASANASAQSSGSFAGGGTVSLNDIEKTLEASIDSNTRLEVTANAPTVISATDQSKIFAIAGAAGIAVTASTGTAITGAIGIALSINDINNTILAKLDKSRVVTKGNLTIDANAKKAEIKSVAVAASVGVSKATGVSVSLAGAGAGSLNDIGNTVSATMTSSGVTFSETGAIETGAPETGRLNFLASDTSTITSYAIGASITAAIGTSNSVAIGFGGSLGLNEIDNTLSATIDASTFILSDASTGTSSLNVLASDTSIITSYAIGAAISAAIGTSNAVAIPIGIALGFNDINNTAEAVIKADSAIFPSSLNVKQFAVNVTAKQNATINSTSVAASVGVGVGQNGIAVSIAGALAKNEISNQTRANIVASHVSMNGNLKVTADDISKIESLATGAAISGAVGGSNAVGVAIGGATGLNKTTNTVSATIDKIVVVFYAGTMDVLASNTSTINSKAIGAAVSAAVGATNGAAVPIAISLGSNEIENTVEAVIKTNSIVTQSPDNLKQFDVNVTAKQNSNIDSKAVAASVGVGAGGSNGVAVGIAGALAKNEITNQTRANIVASTLSMNGNLKVNADDISKIDSLATGASIAGAVGGSNAVGVAIGGAAGSNTTTNTVSATIDDSGVTLIPGETSGATLDVLASNTSTIDSKAIGAAVSAAVGGTAGVAVPIAISLGSNEIKNTVEAVIKTNSNVTQSHTNIKQLNINVTAKQESTIDSTAVAASVGVGAGGKAGVAVAIAGSLAKNEITNKTLANIVASTLSLNGNLKVTADDISKIDSEATGASISGAVGGAAGVGVGAAGSIGSNTTTNTVSASIDASTITLLDVGTSTGTLDVVASDKSTIKSKAVGAAMSAAVGGVAGVAVAVGISAGTNEINNTVEAVIKTNSNVTHSSSIGKKFDVNVTAKQDSTITTTAVAAAVGVGVGGKAGVAVSGAGALAKNKINNQTRANIVDSTLSITGNLKVTAEDKATIDGKITSASVSVGGGLVGVGAALGLSSVENIIPDTALTQAKISGGQFTVGGSVTVDASSTGEMNSDVNAVSIGFAAGAVGVAAAVAGVLASHDLSGKVEAQIQGSGNKENSAVSGVTVQASNNITSDLDVKSASVAAAIGGGGAVSLGVSSATTTLKPIVTATIRDAKLISSSGDIKVTADNNGAVKNHAATASVAASYGGFAIAGGGASATVTATPQVNAMVQDSDINGKNVTVSANSTDTVDADSKAAAIAISIGGFGLGASGSISKVTLEPVLKSEVVKTKVVSENGTLNINTKFTPMATAESAGLAVGTGAAVGLSSSDVMIGGSLISRLDAGDANNKPIKVGALNILTKNNAAPTDGTSSSAKATGASGGLLLGANGAIANIANTTKSTAEIADNNASNKPSSAITVTGKTDISVKSATSQTAEAGSLAVGLLSSGNTLTEAKSDNGTTARIGKNVILNTGDLDLQSISVDNSISTAKLGSFGGIGIALSKGETTTRSITKAIIDDGAKLTVTGKLDADANHTSKYNAKLLSLSGGFISGSGGAVNNVIDSTVNVNIGSRTMVTAGRMDATATNTVKKEDPGTDDNVDADAKGLIAGVKMNHDTTLKLNTTTTIGDNAKIVLTADDAVPSKFEAFQDIKIKDKVKFKAGGLAAGGALVTNIKSTDHNIGVTVGGGVQMDAKTPIHFAANEKADVTIQANSDAYGAATATGNKATIDLKPIKSVTIGSYAKVFSTKDVALLAGMTSNPENPKKDDYKIKSNVDAFAGSLIPLDTIDANAHLLQKNTIDVTQGAEVKSGGDILLYADGDDYQPVSAQAKSVNWISGLSALVNGATSDAEGGVGQFAGESSTKADATVTVKGTLETGIGRNRTLVIEKIVEPQDRSNISEYKVVLSKESDFSDADIKKSSFDVISEDAQALLYAKEQLRIPGVTSQLKQFYEAEVVRLREKITKQGLLESYSNDLDVVTKITTLNLFIPNIIASSGAIRIFADTQVVKDGTLTAPSDPSITVINNTYANLTTSILTIPDHNGGVFVNGRLTTERTTTPTILVENEAIVAADTGRPWPGIEVQQSVNNPSGDVTLKNYSAGAGAINIAKEASIQAATQTIEAGLNGTLNISLGGANSVFEAGGSAYKQVLPFSEPVDQNGRLKGLGTGAINNFANGPVNALNGSTSVLRGARVILKAAYINLNGLIESGRTDYTLLITDAMHREAGEYGQLQKPGLYKLKTNSNPDFTVQFNTDPVGYEYVVSDFAPVGGYVEIHGHLANTGGGKIQVASGYASVKIESEVELNHPIRLHNIDLSQRADGRLVIDDEYKPGQSTIYESHGDYIYKSKSGSVERRELTSTDTYQPKNWLRYGFTIVEDLREVITEYHFKETGKKPLFDWANFGTNTKIDEKVIPQGTPRLSTSGVFFFEAPGDEVQFRYDSDRTETGTTKTPRYNEETRYGYFTDDHYWQVDTTTGVTIKHNHSMRADNPIVINFTGLKEPKLDVNWTNGRVTIDGIIGDDRGVTNIKNTGPVFTTDRGLIQGRQITLKATQFGTPASPVRTDLADKVVSDYLSDEPFKDDSPLRKIYGGERVRVGANHTAGGLPGTVYVYRGLKPLTQRLLTVNYADATLWQPVGNDSQMIITNVSTGDTNIHEVSGDLIIGGIYIQGNTWLRAAGGIQMAVEGASIKTFGYYYQGNPSVLNLVADTGDIGTTKMPVQIRTTSGVSFSAKTPGNVSLFSIRQLFVNEIQAGGDVAIRFAPGFSMADANFIDIRDERAIEELTNTVWKDLQLTKDTGFDAKLASRIAALQAIKTSEYRTYWDLRNQTSDPKNYTSGAQVVMSQGQFDDLRPTLEQEGRMAGFSGDDLVLYFFLRRAEIDIDRTKELHRLHLVVGALTAAFDPTYKYTATDADKKEIKDSMHLWTEQQLQNLRDPSFVASFLKITDTELVIEKPNIIGKTVRIEASGVGTYDHGQTIVLKDAGGNRPKLTLDQRAAVIAAESGDLIFTTRPPVDVAITVQDNYKLTLSRYTKNQDVPYGGTGTWGELGFQVGQSIMLAGEPGSTTDRGVFYKVKSISQDGKILEVDSVMTDGSAARPVHSRPIDNSDYGMDGLYLVAPVITDPAKYNEATHLYVLRREDVDIQSEGKIDVIAASHIFIGSEGDMLLGAIGLAGPGTIQIKANGDLRRSGIEDLLLGNVIRGNVVLLESANGKIGDTGKPLRIGKNDEAILRAKGDIRAESSDKSQLRVKNVYSGTGDVDLKFPGGFVDLCSADVAIRANKINLATDNSLGDIKGISCPFTIDGKTINAKAKDIDLKSTGDLIVGKKAVSAAGGEGEILPEIEGLFATGNLRLESLGSVTILGTMSAGGEMFVSATGQLIAVPESRVLSNGPVTLVLHTLAGSSSPAKFDFLGQLKAPLTVIQGSDGPDNIRFAPAASSSGEVQLSIDKVDSINYGTNWKAGRPTVKDGQFFHVLSSGAQKLRVKGGVRNTNPILPLDVTADGRVDPIDVLVVINLLNRSDRPAWLLSDGPMSSEELASFVYYDVNADGSVDPLDVLTIINLLNRREGSAEGEFVANPGRGDDLLIGGSTKSQDDLASLDTTLADSGSGDWALAFFDLGDIINDDDEDNLWGEKGLDLLFGGLGDKVKQ